MLLQLNLPNKTVTYRSASTVRCAAVTGRTWRVHFGGRWCACVYV